MRFKYAFGPGMDGVGCGEIVQLVRCIASFWFEIYKVHRRLWSSQSRRSGREVSGFWVWTFLRQFLVKHELDLDVAQILISSLSSTICVDTDHAWNYQDQQKKLGWFQDVLGTVREITNTIWTLTIAHFTKTLIVTIMRSISINRRETTQLLMILGGFVSS